MRVLFSLAAFLWLTASPANAQQPPKSNDWPIFLGPSQDNKSKETGLQIPWPKSGPPIVWQRELGVGYGLGVINEGKLYQYDRYKNKARLTCMDAKTGKDIWQYEHKTDYEDRYGYNNGPRCSPLVDGDRVYIYSAEGLLTCLRKLDGGVIWQKDTQKLFGVVQNFFGVGSTPVIEGDLLIAMVGGSPKEDQEARSLQDVRGNGTGIVAFHKMTGDMKYKITDELASYASMRLATINGRRWGFAFARGGLVGFEPVTGKVDFQYPWRAKILESVNASMPVVVGDEVFISETYGPGSSLLKVRPGGYDVVWKDDPKKREKAMQTHWNTPIHHEGYIYGSSGRHTHNAELRCIEWKTGQVKWSIPQLTRISLMYADGHFVALGEYGDLLLFKANPKKFELVSFVRLKDEDGEPLLKYPSWAAPMLVDGLMYVRGDGRLVCLKMK